MKQITIKVGDNEYIIKQSFRSLMEFEKLTKKPASEMDLSVNDLITFLYCVLRACNKETFKHNLDEFIDMLDENPDIINQFSNYLTEQHK
jgi:hypothetical protein